MVRIFSTLSESSIYPPIAQLVEQLALNEKVLGSIPSGRTNKKKTTYMCGLFFTHLFQSFLRLHRYADDVVLRDQFQNRYGECV